MKFGNENKLSVLVTGSHNKTLIGDKHPRASSGRSGDHEHTTSASEYNAASKLNNESVHITLTDNHVSVAAPLLTDGELTIFDLNLHHGGFLLHYRKQMQ